LRKVTSFAATMGLIVAAIANLPNSYLGVAVPGWGGLAAARPVGSLSFSLTVGSTTGILTDPVLFPRRQGGHLRALRRAAYSAASS
jgi:hypothetical protein